MKDEKSGVTLIALVVTITIILILAGISLMVTLSSDGIMEKSKASKLESRYSSLTEKVKIREADIEFASEYNEEGESSESFVNRMKAEGLITKDDDYDKKEFNTIYLGKQKDDSYKYTINVKDESKSNTEFEGISNIVEIKSWGENNFSAIGCLGKNSRGKISSPSKNSFVNVVSFESTFAHCRELEGVIPEDLFSNCQKVTSFKNTFNSCFNLTGNAPNLWIGDQNLMGHGCFNSCQGLSNFILIPYPWENAQ